MGKRELLEAFREMGGVEVHRFTKKQMKELDRCDLEYDKFMKMRRKAEKKSLKANMIFK